MGDPQDTEALRLRRWRLVLGASQGDGALPRPHGQDAELDRALEQLYDSDRTGGLGASSPSVHSWLGDIRRYFPASTVRVLQRDAMQRLGLRRLLAEPELLESLQPDVHLAATLMSLRGVLPAQTRDSARKVVAQVVAQLERELAPLTRQAVRGGMAQAANTRRPRGQDIDWNRTIRKNLHTWLPEQRTIVPERLVGRRRQSAALRDLVLCVDQSGSMASSMVYAAVFAAVLAQLRTLNTHLLAFDAQVVDLSDQLHDPVELLMGVQLGGGTDIGQALTACSALVSRPQHTLVVLISDLFEGPSSERMHKRAAELVRQGVKVVVLLALSDQGAPAWSQPNAAALAALGVPCFACTPDHFPALMAAVLKGEDVGMWAAARGLVTARGE